MGENRIKGQDVVTRFTRGAEVLRTFTSIKSINFQYDLAIIASGYLGETTERKDDVFKGMSGTVELDTQDQEFLIFLDWLVRRARRQIELASARVNVTAAFNFPNGQQPRLLIRNLAFDASNLAAAGRDQYVALSLPYQSEGPRLILT